jgi:putative colanic acid biosynthesis glycosyltransferase WcaI
VRILLLTQLFQPEPNFLKGLGFARQLQQRGHAVQVLTGFPNYPGGRLYPGYAVRPVHREAQEGVEVIRVWHYMSHDRSGTRRALSYLSFALSAAIIGPAVVSRPDVIHVYQGPATLMIPAAVIAGTRGGRIVLDIQDLWPESVTDSGMLPSPMMTRLLTWFCRWTFERAASIVVLSQGFKDRLVELGVPPGKVEVVYNWCDEAPAGDASGDLEPDVAAALLPSHFHVVYAGSMGPLQGLDSVIDAASMLQTMLPRARFVFVGDGVDAGALQERARSLRLSNVVFVPRQGPATVARILARADSLLIHLKNDALSGGAIPQKTQASLAAGRPIIIGVAGEAGALVEAAGAGVRCRPGSPADIARAVADLAALPGSERAEMGRRGKEFYARHLSFAQGCDRMERIFQAAGPLAGERP